MYEGYDPERIGLPPQKTLPERMRAHAAGIPISNEHYVHVPCDDYLDYCHDVGKIITMLKAHRDNEGDKCPLCQLEAELAKQRQTNEFLSAMCQEGVEQHARCQAELEVYKEQVAEMTDVMFQYTMRRLHAERDGHSATCTIDEGGCSCGKEESDG
jgi:hypothetical protein